MRAELDRISSHLGARWGLLNVLDRTRTDASNPRLPKRDAVANFILRDLLKRGEVILGELDSIRQLLVRAASAGDLGPPPFPL